MLDVLARERAALAVCEEAASLLGYDPRTHQDEASLRSTVHAQIGLLLCGVASARVLEERGVVPAMVAGHSIGAFAAAVCAGSLSFETAIRAVNVRARAMQDAFPRGYGMGVVLGVTETSMRRIVAQARERGGDVFVANVNAPTQIAIGGDDAAIERVLEAARAAGARRAERLPVAVPSHGALLEPVAQAVRAVLREATVRAPSIAYLSAMTVRAARDAADVREDLSEGVAHEVRWDETARLMVERGATLVVEAVPGCVLTDLFVAADADVRAESLENAGARSVAALAARAITERR